MSTSETPPPWWHDGDILRLIGIRSVISSGIACVMVSSEHLLFKITGRNSTKTQRALSTISTLGTAQSLFVNSLAGYVTDRFGRKPIIVLGCFMSSVARSLPVIFPTVPSYVVYRLLNSAAMTFITTPLVATLSDRLGGRSSERYQDCLQKRFLVMAIARMITLRIAGRSRSLKGNFIAGSLLPAIAGVLFLLFIRESSPRNMQRRNRRPVASRPIKSFDPFGFLKFFARSKANQAIAALLILQYVPMYNQTETVRRRKAFGWGLRDSEMLLQISNVCECISPWIYPSLVRMYGLDRIRSPDDRKEALDADASPLLQCAKWDFRINFLLQTCSALTRSKYVFFLYPIISMLRISSAPERALDIVLQGSPEEDVSGEGEKIAALGNLSIPVGLVFPSLFGYLYESGNRNCVYFCAALQLFGSEIVSPWAWRRFHASVVSC
eukprot:g130.t1